MFRKLARWWKERRASRLKSGHASPQVVRQLAGEVAHLSGLAECAAPAGRPHGSLRRLREEMETLAGMAERPEFLRLPTERRAAICDRLRRSRQYLIAAMQNGAPPTDKVQ